MFLLHQVAGYFVPTFDGNDLYFGNPTHAASDNLGAFDPRMSSL